MKEKKIKVPKLPKKKKEKAPKVPKVKKEKKVKAPKVKKAIRMFLTQAVAHNGFPFEIKRISENPYLPLSEEQLLQKLELSRKHAEQGQYRNADDVISDMRAKYGL